MTKTAVEKARKLRKAAADAELLHRHRAKEWAETCLQNKHSSFQDRTRARIILKKIAKNQPLKLQS